MKTELLLHDILYLFGGALNIVLAIFVAYSTRKKPQSSGITFILMALSIAVFEISQAIGVSVSSPNLAWIVLSFNVIDFFMATFIFHWFYTVIGEDKKRSGKIVLGIFYTIAILFTITSILFPSSFLTQPTPKLYFNFYYNPGPLYTVMVLYFMVAVLFGLYKVFRAYRETGDPVQKNRYKYVFAALLYGYTIGPTAFLLVYNIPFNPIWSGFFTFYTVPLAYAMVRYELLDIKVFAKRALLYGVVIGFMALLVGGINILNAYVVSLDPAFPNWIGYIIVSAIVGGLGFFVWLKTRETDLLKYEFVTIITHKFRTPLTRIKWSAESVTDMENIPDDAKKMLKEIRSADAELIELTSILTSLNEADSVEHLYHFKKFNLVETVKELVDEVKNEYSEKNVELIFDCPDTIVIINADPDKIKFALEILIRNALLYTPMRGHAKIYLKKDERNKAIFSINDDGIGIPKAIQQRLFTKFYRAPNARSVNTEGTGIGLYMAKIIIERNGGSIDVTSQGEGKGSTFTVIFPGVRE